MYVVLKDCYSKEYFEDNQLLDSSMSLSPLYPAKTSDLHVSTVEDLPSEFLPTSVLPGIDHYLSGLIIHALAPFSLPKKIKKGIF